MESLFSGVCLLACFTCLLVSRVGPQIRIRKTRIILFLPSSVIIIPDIFVGLGNYNIYMLMATILNANILSYLLKNVGGPGFFHPNYELRSLLV